MLTALIAGTTLAAALAATPPVRETGLSTLIDRITASIEAHRPVVSGEVIAARDGMLVLRPGGIAPGTRLEFLTEVEPVTDPATLDVLGSVLERCGLVTIERADATRSRAVVVPGACRSPRPGDLIRSPPSVVHLSLGHGRATPEVAGLLDVLLAVVRGRLERTGRFAVVGSAATGGEAELAVTLSVATEGGQLHALVELRDEDPGGRQDLAHLVSPLVPEALWRDRMMAAPSPYGLMSRTIPGTILAMASRPGTSELLVLTDQALLTARVVDGRALTVDRTVDLGPLARAQRRRRIVAGSLAVGGGRACFATTDLAQGWCHDERGLTPLAGVPVATADGLRLGRWLDGQDIFDGTLRTTDGTVVADLGPFLRLAPTADGGHVVHRPDGQLERLLGDFRPAEMLSPVTGDAWIVLDDRRRAQSGGSPWRAQDRLLLIVDGQPMATRPVAGALVAFAAIEGADEPQLAIATTVRGGPSRVTIQPLP